MPKARNTASFREIGTRRRHLLAKLNLRMHRQEFELRTLACDAARPPYPRVRTLDISVYPSPPLLPLPARVPWPTALPAISRSKEHGDMGSKCDSCRHGAASVSRADIARSQTTTRRARLEITHGEAAINKRRVDITLHPLSRADIERSQAINRRALLAH